MTAADRLRQAAQKIRETSGALVIDEWYGAQDDDAAWQGDGADHIALWSPPVALAVADWLEFTAFNDDLRKASGRDHAGVPVPSHAAAVADLILGGAA